MMSSISSSGRAVLPRCGERRRRISRRAARSEIIEKHADERARETKGEARIPGQERPAAQGGRDATADAHHSRDDDPRLDIGSPAVALAALAEFALLAADQSTHESSVMANFVDGNVHDLVLATTPLEVREDVFAHLVSDPIPEAASLLLCVASAMCLYRDKTQNNADDNVRRVTAVFAAVAVALPLVEAALKPWFHRARPLLNAHTFSFPSGHVAGCAVTVGLLLTGRIHEDAPMTRGARAATWFACIWATSVGRVFADRHWLSDTMGGAALGVALVSLVVAFMGDDARAREL
jgi:membrane-associated phospholipid phosphatase